MKYSYLKAPNGRFYNPYDHGCRKNCSDFLIKGYQEDIEVTVLPQQNSSAQQNGVNLQMGQISRSPSNLPSSSASSSAASSNGTKAHYHQHSSSCSHSNHGHSSNFVVRALGLWRTWKCIRLWRYFHQFQPIGAEWEYNMYINFLSRYLYNSKWKRVRSLTGNWHLNHPLNKFIWHSFLSFCFVSYFDGYGDWIFYTCYGR